MPPFSRGLAPPQWRREERRGKKHPCVVRAREADSTNGTMRRQSSTRRFVVVSAERLLRSRVNCVPPPVETPSITFVSPRLNLTHVVRLMSSSKDPEPLKDVDVRRLRPPLMLDRPPWSWFQDCRRLPPFSFSNRRKCLTASFNPTLTQNVQYSESEANSLKKMSAVCQLLLYQH